MTKGARARRLRKIAQKRGFMLRKSRGPLSRDNRGGLRDQTFPIFLEFL